MTADRFRFRAWDKKNKRWAVYRESGVFNLIGECTMFDLLNQYRIEEHDNLILMQSTGLCDAKGKEVFEGDVVTGKYTVPSEVYWCEFEWRLSPYGERQFDKTQNMVWHNCVEIIGDIYTTPEILRKGT